MGFDRGSVSFRIFYLTKSFDSSLVERFAAHAAPPIETLGREPIQGWVTGRHLLDTRLTEENCIFGGYLNATLMRAERKIPEALLRAHARLEEEVQLRARNATTLPRQVRGEIREAIFERLFPTMPPTLTGLPVVVDFRNDCVLAGAMSDQQIERFSGAFRETTGVLPVALNAETAALKRKRINSRDVSAVSFSPDPEVPPDENVSLGMDFLTWLWWWWEAEGGIFRSGKDGPQYGMILEGPVTFFREGQGAHEAILRKGNPFDSREAGIALLGGKRVKRAKFTLANGDNIWSATVDSDFGFRGVKLPKSEQVDASGQFQERMLHIETFVGVFIGLYDRFLEQRQTPATWKKTVASMREWVAKRSRI
ncbi:MAG: recombination-associated protein RdgC [Kiritimatiellia bacterium]